MPRQSLTAAVFLICLSCQASLAVETERQQAVRADIELLAASGQAGAERTPVPAAETIRKVYERRGFAPAWDRPKRVIQLLEAVRKSAEHGLNPADYRAADLARTYQLMLAGHELSAAEQAATDLKLTDSLVQLVYHQSYGKLDPKTRAATQDYARPLGGRDASTVIAEIIDADGLVEAMSSIMPHDADYDRLKAGLRRFRQIAETGGWPMIPGGATIGPGAKDPRLEILARRLTVSGDLADEGGAVVTTVYGGALQEAVKRFQLRHGLDADGLVGRATLRALNVPVEQRIAQIRVNLERARWRLDGELDDFIRVNIAGYRMSLIRDRKVVSTKKVIVGDTEDQTPIFDAVLGRIIFNPTWTVPHSIASEELLQDIKNDVQFLRRGKYQLFDRDGDIVDPTIVDWNVIHAGNFPYTIVQQPGPANQLGQVKFLFPNNYSVCMHDTPAKSLFRHRSRAFSHGCIRVDEPLEVAALLLADEGWTSEQIKAQVESGETRAVSLAKPLPIVVLYRTVEVNENGEIYFYNDLYERDAAVLTALDSSLPR